MDKLHQPTISLPPNTKLLTIKSSRPPCIEGNLLLHISLAATTGVATLQL